MIRQEDCRTAAKEIVEAYAEELNRQICVDKIGRKGRLVLKKKDRIRKVLTGVDSINCDYYYVL